VIESDTDSRQDLGAGLGFRGWTYVKVAITPNIDDPATSTDICADTGCSITLANRAWVKQFYPEVDFRKRATQVLVRGLGKGRHRTSDYVTLPFYLGGTDNQGRPAFAHFRREVTIVDDDGLTMLLGTDVMGPEKFKIDFETRTMAIASCRNLTLPMDVKRRRTINARVMVASHTHIPPGTTTAVPIRHRLSDDGGQDLLFEGRYRNLDVFATVTDADMSWALVRNRTSKTTLLPRNARIGTLRSFQDDCSFTCVDAEHSQQAADMAATGNKHY
jgi:hypothetical protein